VSVGYLALLLLPLFLGVAAGYAAGGRLVVLASVRLRAVWLLWMAVLVQLGQYQARPVREWIEDRLHLPLLAVVFALVGAWLAVNLPHTSAPTRVAMVIILLGAALNGAAIMANGRMPYSPPAAAAVGLPARVTTPKNEPAGPDTRLAWAGDVIPVPHVRRVLSPGDVLIGLGAAVLIAIAMRRKIGAQITAATQEEGEP
jgi:Family of unknown function (DUF5317)